VKIWQISHWIDLLYVFIQNENVQGRQEESAILRTEQENPITAIRERAKMIEMEGVAGSGKSTLLMALGHRKGRNMTLPPPCKIRNLPSLVRVLLIWLPIYLAKYRHARWFKPNEIRTIGYLEIWLSYIRPRIVAKDLIVALDPGSVYWLSSLKEFGPPFTRDRVFQRWCEERRDQWRSALDLIVWLQAPHELLLQRVMSGNEWHEAKSRSSAASLEGFARLSVSYGRVNAEMLRRKKIRVFHYHTDLVSVGKMIDEIHSTVDLGGQMMSLSYSIEQKLSRNG
jgi:hypothetical protein